jgi:putative transposase
MSYGKEVRRLVVSYVAGGGSKAEAARRFGVSRGRVYAWLGLGKELSTGRKPGPKRSRKVDEEALLKAVSERSDTRLSELARLFDVHESTISYALKRLKVSRKKNVVVHGKTKLSEN